MDRAFTLPATSLNPHATRLSQRSELYDLASGKFYHSKLFLGTMGTETCLSWEWPNRSNPGHCLWQMQ